MKKIMITLAAIVSLQGASMNGAWAGIKAAGRGVNAFIGSPAALSLSGFGVGSGLLWTGYTQGQTNGKLDMIFASPMAQKFLGLDQPTTWYGKTWKYVNSMDETAGAIVRWCSYIEALTRMANAMSDSQGDDDQQQEPQPVKQPKRILKKRHQNVQRARA